MSLPYYNRNKKSFEREHTVLPFLLMLPDIKERIQDLFDRDLDEIPENLLPSIVAGYQSAQTLFHSQKDPLDDWEDIIRVYIEVLNLLFGLGKKEEIVEGYNTTMSRIMEGQEDLHHCKVQLEKVKDADIEVRFKALMDTYHTLYEFLVKHTITLPVFSLDIIFEHKRDANAPIGKHFQDDLSYKSQKISEHPTENLQNDMNLLCLGVDKVIRNSISHKSFEYGIQNDIKFIDRNDSKKITFAKFKNITNALELNFIAQAAALNLFIFDKQEELDFGPKEDLSDRRVIQLVSNIISENDLVAENIEIINDESKIQCVAKKILGFESPSQVFGNIDGKRFSKEVPAPKLSRCLNHIVTRVGMLNTKFQELEIEVINYKEESEGTIVFNLKEFTDYCNGRSDKLNFLSIIKSNTLI